MMPMLNMKSFDERQNTKHLRYRTVKRPPVRISEVMHKPFQYKFTNGTFRNDIYYTIKPTTIIGVYARNIIKYGMPAFILHLIMFFIDSFSKHVLGDEYTTPASGILLLLIVYAVCLPFAYRKISDAMAYFNVEMLVSKYRINQTTLSHIHRSANVEQDEEIAVLERYRNRFNKYSLFPSVKELAIEHQLYQKAIASKNEKAIDYAELRRSRLNLKSKRAEHIAAKEIADWKQEKYGGENEYDELVKKYKQRTIPAVRDIIQDVQSND